MKKAVLVLTVVLSLSFLAFAKGPLSNTYSYSFDGYCDGVQVTVTNYDGTGSVGPKGVPQVLIGGYHDFTSACGLFFDGTVVGMVHNLGMNIPPHYGTSGKVFDLADNSADATGYPSPNFSGVQLQFVLDPDANNWAIYAGFLGDTSEGTYLLNYGTMTPGSTSPPSAKAAAVKGHTTFGRFKTK